MFLRLRQAKEIEALALIAGFLWAGLFPSISINYLGEMGFIPWPTDPLSFLVSTWWAWPGAGLGWFVLANLSEEVRTDLLFPPPWAKVPIYFRLFRSAAWVLGVSVASLVWTFIAASS